MYFLTGKENQWLVKNKKQTRKIICKKMLIAIAIKAVLAAVRKAKNAPAVAAVVVAARVFSNYWQSYWSFWPAWALTNYCIAVAADVRHAVRNICR